MVRLIKSPTKKCLPFWVVAMVSLLTLLFSQISHAQETLVFGPETVTQAGSKTVTQTFEFEVSAATSGFIRVYSNDVDDGNVTFNADRILGKTN